MDLRTILEGCLAKKTRHQKLFYEQFYGYAFRVAFRYIHQHDQAASLINDSFAKFLIDISLLKFDDTYAHEATVRNSLKKIIVYKALDKLSPITITDINSGYRNRQNTSLYFNDQSGNRDSQIIAQLRSLPRWYEVLFNMHVIDGFSLSEIANYFNISVSTCVLHLDQARSFLRELIIKLENSPLSAEYTWSIAK